MSLQKGSERGREYEQGVRVGEELRGGKIR